MDDLLNIGLSNALAAVLLALVALALGSVWRRPALVHGLWLLALLKLVTPPLVRIPVTWPSAAEVVAPDATDDIPPPDTLSISSTLPGEHWPSEPAAALAFPVVAEEESSAPVLAVVPGKPEAPVWPRVLPLIWLAGSLGWFVLALARLERFRRLLHHARPAPACLRERARRLARRLELARCPAVGLLPGRLAPMLWAVGGTPRLLLPASLLDRLDDEHLDTLLVHELAHLRRRDHWVRALEFVVMGLYWWHPVVWYARRELREAEEQCCDAWVVSTLPEAGRIYASALMDTLDFLSTAPPAVPPLASGLGHVSDLKRRLTMILRGTTPRALSWPGCFAVLALGAFFLPMLPALYAQAPIREAPKDDSIAQRIDEQAKAADIEKAKAELAAAEAELRAKMAQLEQSKASLEAAVEQQAKIRAAKLHELRRFLAEESPRWRAKDPQVALPTTPRPKEGQKMNILHIEIFVSPEGVNVEDLRKKLVSVLPENCRIHFLELHRTPNMPAAAPPKPRKRDNRPGNETSPSEPSDTKPPSAGSKFSRGVPTTQPDGEPRDQRINELEQKLEKVLNELRDLRREMKGPRPQSPRGTPQAPDKPNSAQPPRQSGSALKPVNPAPVDPPGR